MFNITLVNVALFLLSLSLLHFNVSLLYVALFDVPVVIVALFTVHFLMLHYGNVMFYYFNVVLFDVLPFSCCII